MKVCELAASVPEGYVTTYGHIARAAGGGAQSDRSITAILSKAEQQYGLVVPWHRIVYADGRVWFSNEHEQERRKLYKKEGIELDTRDRIKNFDEKLYWFDNM